MISVQHSTDHAKIYAMDRICFPHDAPIDLRSSRWWIATVDGTSAGFAGAKMLLAINAVYLSRAGILEGYRGKHLQRRLIQVRVRWARKVGAGVVITDTHYANPASANNLIHCGFRLYLPEDPWCNEGALYWRLEL